MASRFTRRFLLVFASLVCIALGMAVEIAPLHAQNYSGITSPTFGSYLSGHVAIRGTADLDSFWKYELAYKQEPSDEDAFAFLFLAEKPVINDLLGGWDVSALPPGEYTLRLRVVKLDGNYLELYARNLNINLPKPPRIYMPMPLPPPQIADQSQPPRSIQLPADSQQITIDRLLPSPNYASDHTLYALGEGQFLRSLDDGTSWQSAAELEGAAIDWSRIPVAMAKRSPSEVELLLTTPSLLVNPFSAARNTQRRPFAALSLSVDSPYAMQGNLLASDPSRFTWQDIKIPRWFVNEPWLLSHNALGDLWATRLATEETFTLLTQNDLQNLVGARPFLLLKAIPSPAGDAVALVIDTQIDADSEQVVGLQLWVLSLRDGNLRIVAPLQEAVSPLLAGNAEAYVANRNMAVTLGSVSWAHDGKQFAFASAFASDSSDLYRFDLSLASITRLSGEGGSVERIDWSPDDSLLLYTVRHRQFDDISRTSAELYVANANGTAYRRLYNDNSRNTQLVDWTGATTALIYSEGVQESCNLLALRNITIAAQADVGRTEFITDTQVITDANGFTFTQQIQLPVIITTTEDLVMTEILTLTTEPFQTIGYEANRQEVLLAKGERCPGPNPKGLYRLQVNVTPQPQDPQFPQPISLPPPQLISDQVYTTRLYPLEDGRWLVQENEKVGYLRTDNQVELSAPFTDILTNSVVVSPQLSAIVNNQWIWRLENDPIPEFWIGELGAQPQRVESSPMRDMVTNVDTSNPNAQIITFAGINRNNRITLFKQPESQEHTLNTPTEVTSLQLVQPVRSVVPLARLFPPERWTIQVLPISDIAIKQLLPSPNYAVDGTVYLLGERVLLRTTDRGKNWSQLASNQVDGVAQIWLRGATRAANPLSHRLLLATKRGALLQLDPARQPWQPMLPLPAWVSTDDWILVSSDTTLWALRSDGGEVIKLASIDGTVVVDPNPQDTFPAPSPFSTPLRSPDGKWLAFSVNVGFSISPSPVPVLYLLSLESGVLRAIAPLRLPYNAATFTGPDDVRTALENQGMVWSSDGRKLAFLREQVISGTDLFVHDVASATTTRLSEEVGNAYQLRWSPDDRYIAFTSAYSFGTGESYAMSGAWVADVEKGSSHSLYDLPPATTAEEIVGWMTPDTVLVNSRHPLCGSLFLRAIDVSSDKLTPLIPGTFSRVEFSLQQQAALAVAIPVNQQCLSLFLALVDSGSSTGGNTGGDTGGDTGNAASQPSSDAVAIVSTLLQSSVITPGIYHASVALPADGTRSDLINERVGGDLAGIDEGQTMSEFETLKASLLTAPQLNPEEMLPIVSPPQNLGWTTANFFDNGFNATIQLGDAQGQQLNFQTDSTKQMIAAADGLNAFLLTGATTLKLQRLRYPVTRIESTLLVTSALGLSLVNAPEASGVPLPTASLEIEARAELPLLDGGLTALLATAQATGKGTLYLASEQSIWRSGDGGQQWQVSEVAASGSVQSLALLDNGGDESAQPLLARLSATSSEPLLKIDPTRATWQAANPEGTWLLHQPWQLLIAGNELWAMRNPGDALTLLATAPITDSGVNPTDIEPFYQVTPAPDRRHIAWLSPTEPIGDGFQPFSMTLYSLDLLSRQVISITSVQLPNLRLLQEETLLAWSRDGKSLAFVGLPPAETQPPEAQSLPEAAPTVDAPVATDGEPASADTPTDIPTENPTDPGAGDEIAVTPVDVVPATAAIGVFNESGLTWQRITQGFPIGLQWSHESAVVYGLLDPFSLQRPISAIHWLDLKSGESRELYARSPESVDERILGVLDDRLLVQSQHPGCGSYNLRLISLESGEATVIWPGALRYVSLHADDLLVFPSLQSPECNFGADVESAPSVNLYSLQTLTPTLLASISDPLQGVYGEDQQSLWVSTLDSVELLQVVWRDSTIITRSVTLPIPLNTFQQALPGAQQWAGWNRGRSALWLGDYKGGLEGLLTPTVRDVWLTDSGLLATFGVEQSEGFAFVAAGTNQVLWVDASLSPTNQISIEGR